MDLGFLDKWHGFTWNPGLRRLEDYLAIALFSKNAPYEAKASVAYAQLGFRAAILRESGYVKHIGYHQSTASVTGTKKA